MEHLKVISSKDRKQILSSLKERFSISEIPGELFMRGKERIFLFTGDLSEEKMEKLRKLTFIERVGVYFAKKEEKNDEVRLSIEGTQILKEEIKKNVFILNESQVEDWMKGRELNIKTGENGFLAMKFQEDFLGTGKASEEKIGNFIPKNRRLKERQTS